MKIQIELDVDEISVLCDLIQAGGDKLAAHLEDERTKLNTMTIDDIMEYSRKIQLLEVCSKLFQEFVSSEELCKQFLEEAEQKES